MTTESHNTSEHADILNALDEMQQSVAYAVRRTVLADAERIIAAQEQEIHRLKIVGVEMQHRLERDIRALRSQIVEWKPGGAKGAELPTEDEGPYLFGSAHSFGYTRDLELLSQDWHLTDFYIPFAEIPRPLPQPPVTE